MSGELERQLGQLLSELPEPDHDVTERALARTLGSLPTVTQSRRRLGTVAVALASALVLLAVAAGALAAAGALHVTIGRTPPPPRTPAAATTQLSLPSGAHGIAAVIDGRLWLTTSGGMRLQGLPVAAAALSPHALYVAAGIGDSLVAMAPDGHQAWSHPAGGPVRAIAWAPDGLRIAYIVQTANRYRLHVIVANGSNDQLLDTRVRPLTPSWRADSLAFAYVGAGGAPIVYDLGHASRHVITAPVAHDATTLAFAPSGSALAIATHTGFLLTGAGGRPHGARSNGGLFAPAHAAGLAWLDGLIAVAVNPAPPPDQGASTQGPFIQLFRVDHGQAIPTGQLMSPGPIEALDADVGRLTVAIATATGVHVLSAEPGTAATKKALPASGLVLSVPRSSRISALAVR